MTRKIFHGLMIAVLVLSASGCGLVKAAISAGIAYGIYQATKR